MTQTVNGKQMDDGKNSTETWSSKLPDRSPPEELLFVSHVVYGLRLAANMALPGLPLRLDSDVFDVRIRLKDWATFPHNLP